MKESRLGFTGLAALVFGMMVGAGIFNIPQNMAAAAGPWAVMLSWIITAAGMLLLVFTFKMLSLRRPDLNAGLYLYAREGFGEMTGFLSAWGYWLCTAFANVAYVIMLNDAAATFFPSLLRHGWEMVVFGTLLIWIVYFIVQLGMRSATVLNTVVSTVKFGCIFLIIALLFLNIRLDTFGAAFEAIVRHSDGTQAGLGAQVKGTMLVALWCFIGIEGAVMMSGRARRAKDIGRAGVAGFFAAWVLYVLVSLLSYGVMERASLAGLDNPSVAYLLKTACGDWAYWLVIASVVISIGGGWIAWSLVTAEVPYTAAKRHLFPQLFERTNRHGVPVVGLLASSILMELFLFVVSASDSAYLTALDITGMMILPAYFLTGLYLLKASVTNNYTPGVWLGGACSLFCIWMIYAGGFNLFLETSLFYLPGVAFYIMARKERGQSGFTTDERVKLSLLLTAVVISVILIIRG